jgi:hypothetical protein
MQIYKLFPLLQNFSLVKFAGAVFFLLSHPFCHINTDCPTEATPSEGQYHDNSGICMIKAKPL